MKSFPPYFLMVLLCCSLIHCIPSIVFASSDNWVEVTQFDGTIWGKSTEVFTIDSNEWRIKWKYYPTGDPTVMPLRFMFNVVKVGEGNVNFFIPPAQQIGGTLYMNQTGDYYISFNVIYVENYSVTVEQNIHSNPDSDEKWVEVERFSGSHFTFGFSESFQINHQDWRVLWENSGILPEIEDFEFYVLQDDDIMDDGSFYTNKSIGTVRSTKNQNGTLNIHGYTGLFYIWISPSPAQWELIVEQNIDSIPEFPSWMVLSFFMITSLLVIIFRKRLRIHS